MEIELHQLDLRYADLRRRDPVKERHLVGSMSAVGQLLPVVVVRGGSPGTFVLVDGYKRERASRAMRQDTVRAALWDLDEVEALLLERVLRTSGTEGALEEGWFLQELNERFGLSHDELARRFDRSQSWVSRRLALVRDVPPEVQRQVRSGALPAHSAMKFMVPMARANRQDCVRLATSLDGLRPSTRDVGILYSVWASGNRETRELVVTRPVTVLQAHAQARKDKTQKKSAGRELVDDFSILVGASRRARNNISRGLLRQMVVPETEEVSRMALLARCECEALFRCCKTQLFTTTEVSTDADVPSNHPSLSKEVSDA